MASSKEMCLQDTTKELNRRKQEAVNRYLRKQIIERIKYSKQENKDPSPIIIRYTKGNNITDITLETIFPGNNNLVIFRVTTSQIEIFGETYGYDILQISGKIFLYVEKNYDIQQLDSYTKAANRIYYNQCLEHYVDSNQRGNQIVFSTFGAITMFYADTNKSDDIVLLPKDVILFANRHHYFYKKYLADNYFGVAKIILFLPTFDEI